MTLTVKPPAKRDTPTSYEAYAVAHAATDEEAAKRAYLIAAAPELYEALEGLLAEVKSDRPDRDCSKEFAALAKARGEDAR